MTMGPSGEFVRNHLEIAERFLRSSRILLEDGDLRSAVDRAYYAMYHAALAILVWRGTRPPKSHTGLRQIFGKEIILTGLLDKEFGKHLTRAFEMRQSSTYRIYSDLGEEGVRGLIEDAGELVNEVKALIR